MVETKRVRTFQHFSLGGEMTVEEEEILTHEVEKVVCRWCGSADSIEEVAAGPEADPVEGEVGP